MKKAQPAEKRSTKGAVELAAKEAELAKLQARVKPFAFVLLIFALVTFVSRSLGRRSGFRPACT